MVIFIFLIPIHQHQNKPSSWKYASDVTNDILHSYFQNTDYPDFNILSHFDHKSENYSLDTGFYIDRENLLEKQQAKIIIRVVPYLNGEKSSKKILEKCSLKVTTKDGENVDVSKTFDNLKFVDGEETSVKITGLFNLCCFRSF